MVKQRDLAGIAGLFLGMINFIIKLLIIKGLAQSRKDK